ncbi:prephenate dehydrogenase/arogenate dehydrogenase family protein [Corynebacterium freneyi]|uniref:Rossmann-like and DUF2520 domain-containing protein n=1 Tax=Corynebacterium freneyi TaxID=134034 RepID=UPI001EF386E6|nr:prephenate dehydrogenase/arogenate dehydrogenase family protein [Corynebacterium freneyi]MCG7439496.1 prephenate dehydrogenase/arogenate dehydrogenase family protein [Corynebacterium freneyi]MDK8767443.1 prephenate dehydrogenase/arogenate dehydrogenase family protein [Corynebacterium freneyi]
MPGAPRLTVAVISAGAVGTAVGEALARAGHAVTAAVARSDASRARAALRLPQARITDVVSAARDAELIILAVPDPELPDVVEQIVPHVGAGRIVVHVAGSRGRAVLDPIALTGALTIAAHPAMTFAGVPDDTDRLTGCPWGVTVGDELSRTVAELLISEIGGRAIPIPESRRPLYHAAMAHGSNHLGAVVADAVDLLARAISDGGDPSATHSPGAARDQAAALLGPLLEASLDNALKWGPRALTGPAARDDAGTVVKHLNVIDDELPRATPAYRALARRIAEMKGSTHVLRELDDRPTGAD